ncbi:hypothetical protein RKD29_006097 [Streptomyces tendae]|uniref:hypothetical protein n=1 Tax=Streptomyces tendae TaxID=1932 RepID=UPI003836D9D7
MRAQLALARSAGGRLLRAAVSSITKDTAPGRRLLDVREGRSTRVAAERVL